MKYKNIIEWLDALCEAKKTLFENSSFGNYFIFDTPSGMDKPQLFVSEMTFKAVVRALNEPQIFLAREFRSKSGAYRKIVSFLYKEVEIYTVMGCETK